MPEGVPERIDNEPTPTKPGQLSQELSTKELRKLRARRLKDRTVWVGLGMFGVVGWSIALPTLLGVIAGLWLDRHWPSRFSWTLALMLAGVFLGCWSAWHWISQERNVIDQEEKEINR